MQFINFLKTGLRRPETRKKYTILFFLLFSILLYGQNTDFNLNIRGEDLFVSLCLTEYNEEKILVSLSEGLRSEITFHIRVYKENVGILKLVGDRLIAEMNPAYEARWDLVNSEYTINAKKLGTKTDVVRFVDKKKFLKYFFSLDNYYIDKLSTELENCYILGRISVSSIKLVPPFAILSLVMGDNRKVSPWKRIAVIKGKK